MSPSSARGRRRLLLANVAAELRHSPGVRALAAAALVASGGLAAGLRRRELALAAGAAALLERELSESSLRVAREANSIRDAVALERLLGSPAFFGGFAIEADLGRLLVEEVRAGARTVVECGSGLSTVLLATALEQAGGGRLSSLEHEAAYADRTRGLLETAGCSDGVELIVAPLRRQVIGGRDAYWYDLDACAPALSRPIDLLVVDGPVSVDAWSRWPALEVFHPVLAGDATILMDDGRRRNERRAAMRWAADFPDLELKWVDTLSGTWRLDRHARPPGGGAPPALRRLGRLAHPRPPGFATAPVRR